MNRTVKPFQLCNFIHGAIGANNMWKISNIFGLVQESVRLMESFYDISLSRKVETIIRSKEEHDQMLRLLLSILRSIFVNYKIVDSKL